MTVSDLDRLRSRLGRLEDLFPGCHTEMVGGSLMRNPVRPFPGRTITRLRADLEARPPSGWSLVTGVAFVFDGENEFCPGLAVIPAEAEAENSGSYQPGLIEFVAGVVSPGSIRRDHDVKPLRYASRGIADHLVLDPPRGRVVTM
ncbi:Uma2 family endonuclease [Streptomyces griseoviridis]|uniref:Putative restriction endonuclease domain-containing protein n=1 Tax=Streptomyces griseoviridis TaxID=45398 RepID=A0A918GSJ6_STRGD|nr:Uma2 family endonuclease [Streptomyces niveoruber]GGS54609.1 hypothetical protein GCM10010238_50010 [Streptomyces niveoruber]